MPAYPPHKPAVLLHWPTHIIILHCLAPQASVLKIEQSDVELEGELFAAGETYIHQGLGSYTVVSWQLVLQQCVCSRWAQNHQQGTSAHFVFVQQLVLQQ
jgi:hypothetical protein